MQVNKVRKVLFRDGIVFMNMVIFIDFNIPEAHLMVQLQVGIGQNLFISGEEFLFEEGVVNSGYFNVINLKEDGTVWVLHDKFLMITRKIKKI